ncbi:hypothetical protein BC629DRAFT_1440144 [Irpex lacteus]|nr:hypothetical protein BC629DRAFT_1440144 [Irpex lacteus]
MLHTGDNCQQVCQFLTIMLRARTDTQVETSDDEEASEEEETDQDTFAETGDSSGTVSDEDNSDTTDKAAKKNEYHKFDLFLNDHPQCETHRIRLVDEKEARVPDFIGGVLPRKDKERQQEIMKNFNLRYECRDARDDYAAQRRAQGKGMGTWPMSMDDDVLDDMDNQDTAVDMNTAAYDEDDHWEDHVAPGNKSSLLQINRMVDAEDMLQRNGLFDVPTGSTFDISSLPTVKDTNPSGHYWQTLLNKEKEGILQERQKHAAKARLRK